MSTELDPGEIGLRGKQRIVEDWAGMDIYWEICVKLKERKCQGDDCDIDSGLFLVGKVKY